MRTKFIKTFVLNTGMVRWVGCFGLLLFLVACSGVKTQHQGIDFSPAAYVTRAETVEIAEAYRSHRWKPTPQNIFHGWDKEGIRVDTPDIAFFADQSRPGWWRAGKSNEGIPYQWGGFDTPHQFDAKIRMGFAGGDVYSKEKRRLLEDGVSTRACGIDCSGFVSRCWRLERSYSTRELAGLCSELPSFQDLKMGDLVNKTNVHALLFVEWLNEEKTHFMAYETGAPPVWKVLAHPIEVAYVEKSGYRPFRYQNIVEEQD